jgi:hypothetical protein
MKQEEKTILWVDWVQLILICLVAPFFLFPSMKYIGIFLIVPIIWVFRWVVKRRFFERNILDWAIVVLLAQVISTIIIIPNLGSSLPKIAGILFGLAFFYAIIGLIKTEKLIKLGILCFLTAGLLLSIIGILGIQWDTSEIYSDKIIPKIEKIIPRIDWNLPGAEEGFNSNAIGGTLILIIPLCLILFISYIKGKDESYLISSRLLTLSFFFIILFVTCSVLILSLSMGSWIGLAVSIWILLLPWKWKKWSSLLIPLLIAFIFMSSANTTKIINDNLKSGFMKRKAFWSVGVDTISRHPFSGIGMNRIRQIPAIGYTRSHVHNHLLHTGSELGIPGLIAYLAILISVGFMCFEIFCKSKKGWMKMTALGLGCGQLAHFIFGMADSIPIGAKVGIFFWFSLALITAIYNYMLKGELHSA